MTDFSTIYVVPPDIPAEMTIAEYRRLRPCRPSLWLRILGRSS